MKKIKYQHPLPIQVDFPAEVERIEGATGSLHLRPGSTLDVTDAELAHINSTYKDIAQRGILVLSSWEAPPKPKAENAESKSAAGVGNPAPSGNDGSGGNGGKSSKK